ncbi:HNH endonuclease [Pantoea dispersa]|uniref:HNH endonuclease n=1 Tax=Pantoea dispersa TaxID=59814 RepID=UPI00092EF9D0|nr:HNH endonuclease signature motif containing protein [Pantoea dispersa]
MNVIGLNGLELDAKCHITTEDDFFGLVLESWGQKNNPDYNKALTTIIERLKENGVKKIISFLASKPVRKSLPLPVDRLLYYGEDQFFYLDKDDSETLRLKLCKQQKYFDSKSRTNIAKGNGTKRILIHVNGYKVSDWNKIILGDKSEIYEPTDNISILNQRVEKILQSKFTKPSGCGKPEKIYKQATVYIRDPLVVAWILRNSKGNCECCGEAAPFYKKGNLPYLEVHHVIPLSEEGSDVTENCVALCPNCHRAMHFADDAEQRIEQLYQKVSRLIKN